VQRITRPILNSKDNSTLDMSQDTAILQGPDGGVLHLDSETFGLNP